MEFREQSLRTHGRNPKETIMQKSKATIHNYEVPAVPVAEPKAKPLSPNVAQLNESVRALEEEISQKKAALDGKIATARRLRDEQQRLQSKVDLAMDELAVAESQHSYFQARLTQLLETLPMIWANPERSKNQVVRYDGVVEVRAAIADWPRVRAVLQDRVKSFEAELTNWAKNNL
jgi:chromosome segregation ATPase